MTSTDGSSGPDGRRVSRVSRTAVNQLRAEQPEHDLRRCRRHDRRFDVRVLHPEGQAHDRCAQRGWSRRQLRSATTNSTAVSPTSPTESWPSPIGEYLGANVYDKATGDPALAPEYWVTTVTEKKGVCSVGFVGAVTEELPSLVSPAGIEDISVGSPVEAANRVADQLRDGDESNGEADIVILLVHEGAPTTDIASATDPNTRVRSDRPQRRRRHRRDRLGPHASRVQPRDRRASGDLERPVRRALLRHGDPATTRS